MDSGKFVGKLYIREYIKHKEEPHVLYTKSPFEDMFYDVNKQILFVLMKEPEHLRLDVEKVYEFEFQMENLKITFYFKVYYKSNDSLCVLAEYNDNDSSFCVLDLPENHHFKIVDVDKYILNFIKKGDS